MRIDDITAPGSISLTQGLAPLELWVGFECTVARIRDDYRDLLTESGHRDRPEDLDVFAELGFRTLRYPVLWEHVAPEHPARLEWRWHDDRLARLDRLGLTAIIGLLHHGSGPRYTDLLDPKFPELLAGYAEQVARRYPHIELYTPVNEPLTTARFSCLYGLWYPHTKDCGAFLRAVFHECYGTALAMRRIRRITPGARLVQTEDIGRTFSTPLLSEQAKLQNQRRWLSLDLLCGRMTPDHPWHGQFLASGVPEDALCDLLDQPCQPDIVGINHYLSSDRFLDQRRRRYPRSTWGGNGYRRYADVEAVRIDRADLDTSAEARLREAWRRYRLPLAVTEVHNGCTREEQLRWVRDVHAGALRVKAEGADMRAITLWAAFGSIDWNVMLTERAGHYECGLYDIRVENGIRPTALARAATALIRRGEFDHPAVQSRGWWEREMRYYRKQRRAGQPSETGEPLLITGATGTLGRAFARICEVRGLRHRLTARAQLDIADAASIEAALDRERPWAVINTAGYVRVADAEREPERCFRENTDGAAKLAAACASASIPLVSFSTDLVFDGRLGRPYLEDDPPHPACVYGASKAAAEGQVLTICADALVLRTSAFFGPWDVHNFIFHMLRALAAGEEWRATDQLCVSPTYVPDLVNTALDLLIDGETGIWHLANQGQVSWFEFARQAAARAGYDPDRVLPDDTETERKNTALGSGRGRLMPTLDSALDRFFRETEQNWVA